MIYIVITISLCILSYYFQILLKIQDQYSYIPYLLHIIVTFENEFEQI